MRRFAGVFFLLFVALPLHAQGLTGTGGSLVDLARCGAGVASPELLASPFRNPAGISPSRPFFGLRVTGISGWRWIGSQNGSETWLTEGLSFVTPLPIGKFDMLSFGITLVTPGLTVYRIRALPVFTPRLLFLRESQQYLDLAAALALRPVKWLSLGLGVAVEPRVDGEVVVDFTSSTSTSSTSVDVTLKPALLAGVILGPFKGFSIGIAYHQSNSTDLVIPVVVQVSQQIPQIHLRVDAQDLFRPHVIDVGLAWASRRLLFNLSVKTLVFSGMRLPAPNVYLLDEKGKPTSSKEAPPPHARTTVSPALSVTYIPLEWLRIVAGYAFMPSVMEEQTGEANLLDPPKHSFGLGARFSLEVAHVPLGFDIGFQLTYLAKQTDEKLSFLPDNPGYPRITYKGVRFVWGIGTWLGF